MNNVLSLKRLVLIIRKDLFSELKNLMLWVGASAGVMIVISALNILFQKVYGFDLGGNSHFHVVFYLLLLFPGGFILTSSMFKDLHDKSRNIYWLMNPGSTFEKLLSRLLISSLFYVIVLSLFYPILAGASEVFNSLVFGMRHDYFNPFHRDIIKLIPYYFVIQSIFFAGAVQFRKHPFAKTILSITALQIVLSILFVLIMKAYFGNYFNSIQNLNFHTTDLMNYSGLSMESIENIKNVIELSLKIIFWGLMTPFFYILSYFKLSEKEVCDGF